MWEDSFVVFLMVEWRLTFVGVARNSVNMCGRSGFRLTGCVCLSAKSPDFAPPASSCPALLPKKLSQTIPASKHSVSGHPRHRSHVSC